MTLLTMSNQELKRIETLQLVVDRRLSVTTAADLMRLSRRQATRLIKVFRDYGAPGLISEI